MNCKQILVVEADQGIVKALSNVLQRFGYGVIQAADGSEAVSAVRRDKPNLIVLDTTFPPDVAHGGGVSWDGFLIMEWLHRMDEAQGTPVILISGADVAKYQERFASAGIVAFFQKPVNFDELMGVIHSVMNTESPQGAA